MTEQLTDTVKIVQKAWASTKPEPYPNGGSFGKRDIFPVLGMLLLCVLVYLVHDVAAFPVPLPSEETVAFFTMVFGLYLGRKLRR